MRILAIETSCDETSIAIAEFNLRKVRVFSHIVLSQIPVHKKFGGVVPNLAKREHQKNLVPILLRALREAGFFEKSNIKNQKSNLQIKIKKLERILEREQDLFARIREYVMPLAPPKIDAIAVTCGPGLAPALWVGVNFAKALAYLWGKPLVPINHMAGHLYSAFLQKSGELPATSYQLPAIKFPALALLVSGGHTELVLMRGHGKFKILGETLDDAAGEAFDKVARILGLKYPGGPKISRCSELSKSDFHNSKVGLRRVRLPRPMINTKDYNFSFSGLKTAVLYLVRDLAKKYSLRQIRPAIAKEFQDAVVEVLIKKTVRAAKEYKVKTILLGGGVAANKELRKQLAEKLRNELPEAMCWIPEATLAGDNALMIAMAAYFTGKKIAPTKIGADANLKLS